MFQMHSSFSLCSSRLVIIAHNAQPMLDESRQQFGGADKHQHAGIEAEPRHIYHVMNTICLPFNI